ncbi:MAG: hypothetical protein H5U00_08780 [Clostridia bacterium]|nr:hypothetical protein [Clostridia bacterium]
MVQELLGHARIAITADTYAHVSAKLKREAVAKLNGTLTAKKKSLRLGRDHYRDRRRHPAVFHGLTAALLSNCCQTSLSAADPNPQTLDFPGGRWWI